LYEPYERETKEYTKEYDILDDVYSMGMTILRFLGTFPALEEVKNKRRRIHNYHHYLLNEYGFTRSMDYILTIANIPFEFRPNIYDIVQSCFLPRDRRLNSEQLMGKALILAEKIGYVLIDDIPMESRILSRVPVSKCVEKWTIMCRHTTRYVLFLTIDLFYRLLPNSDLTEEQEFELLDKCEGLARSLLNVKPRRKFSDLLDLAKQLKFSLYWPVWNISKMDFETMKPIISNPQLYHDTYFGLKPTYDTSFVDDWIE